MLYIGFRFRHWIMPICFVGAVLIAVGLRSAAGRVALAAAKGAIKGGRDEYKNQSP
jgi:hypothetical protein